MRSKYLLDNDLDWAPRPFRWSFHGSRVAPRLWLRVSGKLVARGELCAVESQGSTRASLPLGCPASTCDGEAEPGRAWADPVSIPTPVFGRAYTCGVRGAWLPGRWCTNPWADSAWKASRRHFPLGAGQVSRLPG